MKQRWRCCWLCPAECIQWSNTWLSVSKLTVSKHRRMGQWGWAAPGWLPAAQEPTHVSEVVRQKLAHHLNQAYMLTESATEESYSEEEMSRQLKLRKTLKSVKVRTAKSTVVKSITWPHEHMYTSGWQLAIYEQLTMPLFVSGYIVFLDTVKSGFKEVMLKHLWELMADADTYG